MSVSTSDNQIAKDDGSGQDRQVTLSGSPSQIDYATQEINRLVSEVCSLMEL